MRKGVLIVAIALACLFAAVSYRNKRTIEATNALFPDLVKYKLQQNVEAHEFVVDLDDPVPINREFIHRFRLENATDETFHIDDIKQSCSCASVTLSTETISPGSSAIVTVIIGAKRGFDISERITLIDNGSRRRFASFRLRGVRQENPELFAQPGNVNYSCSDSSEQFLVRRFAVRRGDFRPFEVNSVFSSAPWVHVRQILLDERFTRETVAIFEITLDPGVELERLSGQFVTIESVGVPTQTVTVQVFPPGV